MPKSHDTLEHRLAGTLRAVRGLHAKRQDNIEDYFHDAIVKVLDQEKALDCWLGYLYKSVAKRIACGQEGRVHLPLDDGLLPEEKPVNNDLILDIKKAISTLRPTQQRRIYQHFYLGQTFSEIAQEEGKGVSPQAIEDSIDRGLDRMKKVLEGKVPKRR